MLIERIWAANALRNYHYLIACPETGEALVIDPLDAAACLKRARELGWSIRQVFNTHEHADHTGGNSEIVTATGAAVLAHAAAAARIGGVTRALVGGDIVRVGRAVELRCLDTPGHTLAHICLYGDAAAQPALFAGDTLFNAGVGNCTGGGDPERLYDTFAGCIAALPDSTRVFPGHDYMLRNLGFTLEREPGNEAARALAQRCAGKPAESMPVMTLGEERTVNAFLRLSSPEIIEGLVTQRPQLRRDASPRAVFLALRGLRNRY